MYAASNRRERRRNAKVYKEPWKLSLMPYSGSQVKAGVYYDILNTQWAGAEKCSYEYYEGMTWSQLLMHTKLYFPPLHDKFQVVTSTGWSPETRFLFTVQGKGLMVNISFFAQETYTINLLLKDCIFDFGNLEEMFQKKSSSLFQVALKNWRMCASNYTMEQKKSVYDAYCVQGHSDDWAKIMSGLMVQDHLEFNICMCIMNELLMPLLNIFRTLAFMDYSMAKGHHLLEANLTFAIPKVAIADVEASCTNHRTAVSNCPIEYADDTDLVNVKGNIYSFYDVYSPPIRIGFVEWLRRQVLERELDLEQITENSRNNMFFIDVSGNPMKSVGYEEQDTAQWMVTGTGLHESADNFPIFGLYKREGTNKWQFLRFLSVIGLCRTFEHEGAEGFSLDAWQPLLNKSFEIRGKGLRDYLEDEDQDLPVEVQYYRCSNKFFELVKNTSNIKTLDQANFFIDGFLRMLRQRGLDSSSDSCYNTGMVDENERFVWFYIPNIMGKFNRIQPELVDMSATGISFDPDCSFYRDFKELLFTNKQIYVNERSLMHMSDDREFRIPTGLASMSETQLIEWVRDSIQHSLFMLAFNPLYAQPCYSERYDCICHLIPLYTNGQYNLEHLAGALFVYKGNVKTIYTVEMARDHACLFSVPKASWLPD